MTLSENTTGIREAENVEYIEGGGGGGFDSPPIISGPRMSGPAVLEPQSFSASTITEAASSAASSVSTTLTSAASSVSTKASSLASSLTSSVKGLFGGSSTSAKAAPTASGSDFTWLYVALAAVAAYLVYHFTKGKGKGKAFFSKRAASGSTVKRYGK